MTNGGEILTVPPPKPTGLNMRRPCSTHRSTTSHAKSPSGSVLPGSTDPDGDLAWEVVERCVEQGLLMFSPVGFGGGTVKISPPLVIHEAAILEGVAVLEEALTEAVSR